MKKNERYVIRYWINGKMSFVTRNFRHMKAALKTAEKLISNALITYVEVLCGGLGRLSVPVRSFK